MKEHLKPTRHGDWHVINGKLVDLSAQPAAPAPAPVEEVPAPVEPDQTAEEVPQPRRAKRRLFGGSDAS